MNVPTIITTPPEGTSDNNNAKPKPPSVERRARKKAMDMC